MTKLTPTGSQVTQPRAEIWGENELRPLRNLALAFAAPVAGVLLFTDGGKNVLDQVAEQYRATFLQRPPLVESAHHLCEHVTVTTGGELCATNLTCLGHHLGVQPIGASYQVAFPERYSFETTLLNRNYDSNAGMYTYEFGSSGKVQLIVTSDEKLCSIPFELHPNETHKAALTFLQGVAAQDRGTTVKVQIFNSAHPVQPLEATATLERLYLQD